MEPKMEKKRSEASFFKVETKIGTIFIKGWKNQLEEVGTIGLK